MKRKDVLEIEYYKPHKMCLRQQIASFHINTLRSKTLDRCRSRRIRKTVQFRGIFWLIILFYLNNASF